ncbi:MAG: hypothetical protein ACI9BW_003864 [Gammaproteobacteria bacterium]|jgi:hypothetical protein
MRRTMLATILLLSVVSSGSVSAADDEPRKHLDCSDPLKAAPAAVKGALGHLYHKEASIEKLVEAHAALNSLVSDATNCRLNAQSAARGSDGTLVREWISLHDWINRLADFVYLKSIGRGRANWEIEYADFAKLYEFEA